MLSFLSKNMLPVTLVGLLVLGGAWYAFSDRAPTETLISSESTSGPEGVAERGIVDTLLTLRAVTLSGTIFSDPTFRVLRDFGTPIVPEPAGRENPFAPRGGSQTTTSAATN